MFRRAGSLLVGGLAVILCVPATAGELISIAGPLPAGGAHRIAHVVSFYGDYGTLAIAEGSVDQARELARLGFDAQAHGSWPEHGDVLVALHDHVPATATVLRRTASQALVVVTHGSAPVGVPRCGHAAQPVARVPYELARGFVDPRGQAPGTIAAIAPDARIAALIAQVSAANLSATVTQLANFGTRRADSQGIQNAKNWLIQQLSTISGVTVTTSTFSATYAPNIVITKTGLIHPERIVVLGAHYDSINLSSATGSAPGADDNASGSAGILESARLLAQIDFESTIRMVLFSAEEFGLTGSAADASALNAADAQVVAMLNMDMIAHRDAGDALDLDFATNDTDATLTQFCRDVCVAYVPSLPTVTGVLTAGTSDHKSYQQNGFPSAFLFEDLTGYSKVIHTANDVVGSSANDFALAAQITKVFVAAAAEIAKPVDLVLTHVALPDTADAGGPYALAVDVTSLTPAAVESCAVTWRVDGGAWQSSPLFATTTPGHFVGSLPGIPMGAIDYWFMAADDAGHTQWLPSGLAAGSSTFTFHVGAGTTVFADGFEGAGENGWTSGMIAVQNDWQKGTPQGKGGYDPSSAGAGSNARGNDLGIGNFNGNYASNASNWLESPSINCAGASGLRLRFLRFLSVEDGLYDRASVRVNGALVWQNQSTAGGVNNTIDGAWTPQDFDVSALADNNPNVKVRFELQADGGLEFGGWTIDELKLESVAPGFVPALATSARYVSASQGSSTQLKVSLGTWNAGRTIVIALSASGTSPCTTLAGVSVPLNFDAVTDLGFALLNTPVFSNFAQPLSSLGTATATLNLPPLAIPALAGLTLHASAFTFAPIDVATVAVPLTFVP